MAVLDELRRLAAEAVGPGLLRETMAETLESTDRVHDWRNHIPQPLMDLWPRLSESERLIIVLMAEEQAVREEYE